MKLKEFTSGLIHLLYPQLCEGCSRSLLASEQVLCANCLLQLPMTEYHDVADNDTALRLAGRIPFRHATSFAWFTDEGLLQHLMHGLKYAGKKDIGIFLGNQFGSELAACSWGSNIDAIIPVPLAPEKEAFRGYNQSTLIARGISSGLHVPVLDKQLIRIRNTESQTQKNRSERIENMKDAFSVCDTASLQQKHILLIDDVLTTGATLEACALALAHVSGIKVSIASIGIAG
ncbi:MAG: ComF family protein [Flavipsychrobacter sp.]